MTKINITCLVKTIHEQEVNRKLLAEVRQELENSISGELLNEVSFLVNKVESAKFNVTAFPSQTIPVGETSLMAASGKVLGTWFAQPIIFSANGFVVDIRKVLGSDNDVDVYIYSNSSDEKLIEKALLPFKDQSLKVRFSINEKEFLNAEIYVDDTGHAAEGSGHLKSVGSEDIHGTLNFEVIVED